MYALFDLDGDSTLTLNDMECKGWIYGGQFLVHFPTKKTILEFEREFLDCKIYNEKVREQMSIITREAIILLLLGEEDRIENGNYSIKVFKELNINQHYKLNK